MLRDVLGIGTLGELREAMAQELGDGGSAALDRRVRYWTQGLVIGSRLYLSWVMSHYRPPKDVLRHRSARMETPGAHPIYAWRRLRTVDGL